MTARTQILAVAEERGWERIGSPDPDRLVFHRDRCEVEVVTDSMGRVKFLNIYRPEDGWLHPTAGMRRQALAELMA